MTVNTINIKAGPYDGNGITDEFSFSFRVENKNQLVVYLTEQDGTINTLVVDTDYTVGGIGDDDGGVITMTTPPATGESLFIRANYSYTQETDFENQGGFFPDVHERAFDKNTFLAQQIKDILDRRTLLFDDSFDRTTTQNKYPTPQAGKVLAWDVDGSLYNTDQAGTNDDLDRYDSIASFITASPVSDEVIITSANGGWAGTLAGPKGGHKRHKTGETVATTSVSNPATSTEGTAANGNAGYSWDANDVEWVREFNGALHVDSFSANGAIGNTDDSTTAFADCYQAILNLSGGLGGEMHGDGYYNITTINTYANINYDFDGGVAADTNNANRGGPISTVRFVGSGRARTQIRSIDGVDALIKPSAATPTAYHVFQVHKCTLQGYQKTNTSFELLRDNVWPYRYEFSDVAFINFEYGFKYDRYDQTDGNPINGFAYFDYCQFSYNRCGAMIGGDNQTFNECLIQYNDWCGLWIDSGAVISMNGGKIQYNGAGGWDTWTPPTTGNLIGPFQWLCSAGAGSITFNNVYFEPKSSSSAANAGYTMWGIYPDNSSSNVACINIVGGRVNGLQSQKLLQIDQSTVVDGFNINGTNIRNFKLDTDLSLIDVDSGGAIRSGNFMPGRIDDMLDSGGSSTDDWQLFTDSSDVRRITNYSKYPGLACAMSNNAPLLIAGNVSSTGAIRSGSGYSVNKTGTGVYEITLPENKTANLQFLHASANAYYRSAGSAQVSAYVDNTSATVITIYTVFTVGETAIDFGFSFSAVVGVK